MLHAAFIAGSIVVQNNTGKRFETVVRNEQIRQGLEGQSLLDENLGSSYPSSPRDATGRTLHQVFP